MDVVVVWHRLLVSLGITLPILITKCNHLILPLAYISRCNLIHLKILEIWKYLCIHNVFFGNEEYLKESVANISHDLRTPLTVILGHLQLLQKENWESSQAQRVKVIFSKAEKMKELVETFYDLSILEEQQTVPEKEKFNISNMLINLITENAVALEKENILPEINLPDYSIYVYSDKNMVERILQNLLTNAIKYSVGTIKITLMEKENNNIIFTIENPMSDSSEIDCNRLFDRFYTGDKSRHNGSTGLGLAVVKTLVAILGGNIVAKVHANSLIITLEL